MSMQLIIACCSFTLTLALIIEIFYKPICMIVVHSPFRVYESAECHTNLDAVIYHNGS